MIYRKVFSKPTDATVELEEVQTELDIFLYRASHDLKGPLARIEGLAQLMKYNSTNPEIQDNIKMIESLTLEMNGVINNLIHARDIFKINPAFHHIDPKTLVEEIVIKSKSQDRLSNVKLNIKIDFEGPWFTDPLLARIILSQLVKSLSKCKQDRHNPGVDICLFQEDSKIIIEYSNPEKTILPEHIDRIFEPFFNDSKNNMGAGLGLYLVKKSVFQLNGTIEVKSDPNQGITLRIILPQHST